MKQLAYNSYPDIIPLIDYAGYGAVYARSVAEQTQSGEIYLEGSAALIWHTCGFALVCGNANAAFLRAVDAQFLHRRNPEARRFLLFVSEDAAAECFAGRDDLLMERRFFFTYQGASGATPQLPAGFQVREMTAELIAQMHGRIVPRFSWEHTADFLEKGKGFCVTDGEAAAGWAFSAAVSGEEIDIGVETDSAYRQRGLATAAAQQMIQYSIAQNKRPVWSCHAENAASRRLAEKLGFVKTAECITVKER